VGTIFANYGLYELIITGILAVALFIQLLYYLIIFVRVAAFKPDDRKFSTKNEPVSVIICARNEAENLSVHLPVWLTQDYPDYEVVVVNDCSDDETQDILERFQTEYAHLRTTHIKHDEKFTHGKKLALTIGIKAAKHEWLLLTDADCTPTGVNWISSMQRNFTDQNEVVLGYGGYNEEKGFLNKMIRFDTFFIALQYLGFALIKAPYMGVGRNLAYRKSLFMKNKGFASHAHVLSGDDDLFINEVAKGKTTSVEFSHEAHTRSIPKTNFNSWTYQKKRHLSTGKYYRVLPQFLLGGEILSRFFFYVSVLLLSINPDTWIIGLSALFFRWIIQLIIFNGAMNKLNEKKILLFSLLFDLILPLLNIFLYSINTLNSKQNKWK
jgi:cellulose synthase/poly-beta-1,6-N-acetylglucosamine synthase-like glycosyltransferase